MYVHTDLQTYICTYIRMYIHPHTTSEVGHYMHAEQGSSIMRHTRNIVHMASNDQPPQQCVGVPTCMLLVNDFCCSPTCMYVCSYVCTYVCICNVCMYVCMYVHMYVYICTYIHNHMYVVHPHTTAGFVITCPYTPVIMPM